MSSSTQTLAEFIAEHDLSIETVQVDRNPHMLDDAWSRDASHYRVVIRNVACEKMTLFYSMGSAHTEPPTLEMVLDALASDAASVADSPDWLDWAEEMGYEGASALRAARTAYETITRQAAELRDLLGDEPFEALLYNTERL